MWACRTALQITQETYKTIKWSPCCCYKRGILQICLRNLKQPSLSPKYFPYPPCKNNYSLGKLSIEVQRLSVGCLPTAMVIPYPALLLFLSPGRKMLHPNVDASWGSCEADITPIHQRHKQEVYLQANRQKCPHLLTVSTTTEVKGRCLLLLMFSASHDENCK